MEPPDDDAQAALISFLDVLTNEELDALKLRIDMLEQRLALLEALVQLQPPSNSAHLRRADVLP